MSIRGNRSKKEETGVQDHVRARVLLSESVEILCNENT